MPAFTTGGPTHNMIFLQKHIKASVKPCPHQVVHHVCADVVLDLVEHAVVLVQGGQASTQVAPLLTTVPGHLLILSTVVVQVGHHIKPRNKDPVARIAATPKAGLLTTHTLYIKQNLQPITVASGVILTQRLEISRSYGTYA